MFSYSLQRDCSVAKSRRQAKLDALRYALDSPLTAEEERLHSMSLTDLVDASHSGSVSRRDILLTYGKRAFAAQTATNCLSDIMIADLLPDITFPMVTYNEKQRLLSECAYDAYSVPKSLSGPLAGVPVSIKDCIDIAGYPTTLGYSARASTAARSSAAIVELLRDAGATLHAKTTVPCGIFGLETTSALFGRTSNPRNPDYSPGASTGGGSALLGSGGSMIEVGTDIGGSVRIPAAWCGLYSLKGSAGRFPFSGSHASSPGLESLPTVASPMARTLDDLAAFWERVVQMRPWEYDHTCVPLPWKASTLPAGTPLRFGVVWSDGMTPLSPASKRALDIVIAALRARGHEVVEFDAPMFEPLKVGFQLAFGDGADCVYAPLQPGERPSSAIELVRQVFALPRIVKTALAYFLPPRDAELAMSFNRKTLPEERALIVEREHWRRVWHRRWRDEKIDFLLTAPTPVPGIPKGGEAVCGLTPATYALLFNILDLPAGVMPITEVSRKLDTLPPNFVESLDTEAARSTFKLYDADKMHGLPVAVQVVGPRLEEERVLAAMKVIEDAVKWTGEASRAS